MSISFVVIHVLMAGNWLRCEPSRSVGGDVRSAFLRVACEMLLSILAVLRCGALCRHQYGTSKRDQDKGRL